MSGGQDLDPGSGFKIRERCPQCNWPLKDDGTCGLCKKKADKILDDAADKMAEQILSGSPDIPKCFALGINAMKPFEIRRIGSSISRGYSRRLGDRKR
jgi:hypothetical protein